MQRFSQFPDIEGEKFTKLIGRGISMQQPSLFVQGNSTVSLLYQDYASVILIYVRRLVPSWEDAEDIVLEVFLAALEQEKLLAKLSDQAQKAWLRRVAHNKVIDHYRQRQGSSSAVFEGVGEWISDNKELTPEQAALQQEAFTLLRTYLASLPKVQQEVLRLRFEAGLRCKDIAALLHRPEGTVRSLLSRSLNYLRTLYQEESGG
jgi:RNA polymerase sigma factor (sigma-70 family)